MTSHRGVTLCKVGKVNITKAERQMHSCHESYLQTISPFPVLSAIVVNVYCRWCNASRARQTTVTMETVTAIRFIGDIPCGEIWKIKLFPKLTIFVCNPASVLREGTPLGKKCFSREVFFITVLNTTPLVEGLLPPPYSISHLRQ